MECRLAAILAADVVGYSRLMGQDEASTLAARKAHRAELIGPKNAEHEGRVFGSARDSVIAEFASRGEAAGDGAIRLPRGSSRGYKDPCFESHLGIAGWKKNRSSSCIDPRT